jgi:deoxyuridine 5'-triphosphate nucleotidohydrolase
MLSFSKTRTNAKLPVRATPGSAGLDVFSVDAQWLYPNSTVVINTGLRLTGCPNDIYLRIAPRSSLGVRGIHVLAGVVDSDYRGEIKVVLYMGPESNTSIFRSLGASSEFECQEIKKHLLPAGSKICQLIPEKHEPQISCQWSDALSESERGAGGFGSTGV